MIGAPPGLHVGAVAALLLQVDGGVLGPGAERTSLGHAGAEAAVEKGGLVVGRDARAEPAGTVGEAERCWRLFQLLHRFVQGVFGARVPGGRSHLLHNLVIKHSARLFVSETAI